MIQLRLDIAGEQLLAHQSRTLAWPSQRALLVSDLHLGKAQVFRQAGLAMPEGSDARDLDRLAGAIEVHRCERLILLGDTVHGATTQDAPWRAMWQSFVARHAQLDVVALVGNHDRHDRHALAATTTLVELLDLGPFHLRHFPSHANDIAPGSTGAGFVIAGHVHPLVELEDSGRIHRLPCFWLQPSQLILPSFGSTTRGQAVTRTHDDRIIAVTPAGLLEVPRKATLARRRVR